MKFTFTLGILLLASVSGCAVTKDGLGMARRPPDTNQVQQAKNQLQHNEDAVPGPAPRTSELGVVVVGTTGPLRLIEDKDRDGFYAAYAKVAGQWHPGEPPSMDAATYQQKLGGWASIQITGIPGLGSIRMRMLVPRSVLANTTFASAAGSFMFGTTGDLVVAKSDHDSILWLDHVLCRDDATYSECSKNYSKGVYDAVTGQQLDRQRKPKVGGAVMDLSTFRVAAPGGKANVEAAMPARP